jgi:hypothetical protein
MKYFSVLLFFLNIICLGFAQQQDIQPQVFKSPLITEGVVTRFSSNLISDSSVQEAINIYFDEDFGIVRRKGFSKYNQSAIGDSESVRGLWDFLSTDGTNFIIALSSNTVYSSIGDNAFTPISSLQSFNIDSDFDAIQYLGKFWITNNIDGLYSWDGSGSAVSISSAPVGSLVEGWRNRIVLSGVSGNLSRLYLSEELDGTNWATGGTASGDPVIFSIGGINGKPITCMYAGYKDLLIAMTEDDIYAVYGFGQDDFAVRHISREVGCIDDKSIKEKEGNLLFLSRRGLEKWSGTEIQRVSEPIRDLFDIIIENSEDLRFLLDTSQSDFEAGNLTANGAGYPVSSTQKPASIEPKKTTFEDAEFLSGSLDISGNFNVSTGSLSNKSFNNTTNEVSEWNQGAFSNTELIGSQLRLKFEDKIENREGVCTFSGETFTIQGWDVNGYPNEGCGSCVPACGGAVNLGFGASGNHQIKILDGAVVKITKTIDVATNPDSTVFTSAELYSAGLVLGNTYTYRAESISDSSNFFAKKDFVWWGGGIDNTTVLNRLLYLIAANGYAPNGTYTSEVFDTEISEPNYYLLQATESKPTNTNITYEMAVSTDGITFDSWTAVLNGADPSVNNKRYFKYRINMSHTENATPTVDDIQIKARGEGTYTSVSFNTEFADSIGGDFDVFISSGTPVFSVRESTDSLSWDSWQAISTSTQIPLTEQYWQYKVDFTTEALITKVILPAAANNTKFIHRCFNIGTNINNWDLFQSSNIQQEGGSINYEVVSSSACASVESPSAGWVTQNNNAEIVVSTNTYLGVRETFVLTKAESVANIQDVQINWNEGGNRPSVASVVYRDRYYVGFTDSNISGQGNNKVAVLDKRDAWTTFDNINCASTVLYNRKWYCGSSTDNGFVYLMDVGQSDDGSDFTSKFRTKAYSFGNEDAEKEFQKLYVSLKTDNSLPEVDIDVYYRLDGSDTRHSLGTINLNEDSSSGILQAKVPFRMSNNLTGRYLDLEFTNTGQKDFTIYNFNIYYKSYPVK